MVLAFFGLLLIILCTSRQHYKKHKKRIPLIIDFDYGGPIDDSFALTYILQQQNIFDIKLLITVKGNTTLRAEILGNYLSLTNNINIPIGIGLGNELCDETLPLSQECVGPLVFWHRENNEISLQNYINNGGIVYKNGIKKMLHIIKHHNYRKYGPLYILQTGALTNIAHIFGKFPYLARKVRLFSLSGSYKNVSPFGYFVEFNVRDNITATRQIFNNPKIIFNKKICISGWDTGYFFQIQGNQYQRLLRSNNIEIQIMLDQYRVWFNNGGEGLDIGLVYSPLTATPGMFDLLLTYIMRYVAINNNIECDNVRYLNMNKKRIFYNISGFAIFVNSNIFKKSFVSLIENEDNGFKDYQDGRLSNDVVNTFVKNDIRHKKRSWITKYLGW